MKTSDNIDFLSSQVTSADYYYINLTPKQSESGTVVCGGREQCAPDYCLERNGFRFLSIEFVSSGCGTLTLHGQTWPLRLGAVFCYGPDIPHRIQSDPSAPLLKHFVDVTGSGLATLLKRTALNRAPLYASQPFRMRDVFEALLQTGMTESRHRNELCVLLLRQILLYADETALPLKDASSPAWQTYLRCRQFIEQHFTTIGRVEQAARQCHLDIAYLCRLFKRYANESPLQMLTRLKMARAADLLATRSPLIRQAGAAVGYPDPYHFSRVFKRVYGIPPEAFLQAVTRNR